MPEKKHNLTGSSFLTDEAIRAILAKEALIKGDISQECRSVDHGLIGSSAPICYVVFEWSLSASPDCGFVYYTSQPKNDPFGDEEELKLLYAEFAEEDRSLANEGLTEFRQVMLGYDGE